MFIIGFITGIIITIILMSFIYVNKITSLQATIQELKKQLESKN